MILRATITLSLALLGACGGAVFTIGPAPDEDDAGPSVASDAPSSPGPDAGPGLHPDAAADTHAPPDPGPDAPGEPDAAPDAPVASDASCAAAPTSWTCSYAPPSAPSASGTIYAPAGYCAVGPTYGLQTNLPTPMACRCPGHYTCACLLAELGGRCPFGPTSNAVLSCDDEPNAGPRVTCAH